MPIGIRTPGPIQMFGTIRGQSPQYLGTCITAPEPEAEKFKIPVMNDLGGRSVPFQLIQDGEIWSVALATNRFNMTFVNQLLARETGGLATPGIESGYARGTLYLGVSDWSFTYINTYAGTGSSGSYDGPSDLIGGRTFETVNIKKYKESTIENRVLEISMMIECLGLFTGDRGFSTYKNLTVQEMIPFMNLVR